MASTDAKEIPLKNTAYRLTVPMWKADGTLCSSLTGLDSEVSKDGGAFADCTNEATEIATNSGVVYLDLTSTEMNADTVCIKITATNVGAVPTVVTLNPQPSTPSLKTSGVVGNVTGSVGSVTGAVGSVTGNVGGNVTGSVGSLAAQAKADVNAEVVDVIRTDTLSELTQGIPPATPTLAQAAMLPYMAIRNKIEVTATEKAFYNDAGTKIAKKTLSDDGTTYTEAEAVSGA